LLADLIKQGSVIVDVSTEEVQWFHHGAWRLPSHRRINVYSQTRPFLEWHLKRHLALHSATRFLTTTPVIGLQIDPQKQRVIGVQIRPKGKGAMEILKADLVIDASGRGSRSPLWLEK